MFANIKKETLPRWQMNKPLSIRPKRVVVQFPITLYHRAALKAIALKTMYVKRIACFFFYCDPIEHLKFLKCSEMTLGLLYFNDLG